MCKLVPSRVAMQLEALLGPLFNNNITCETLILPGTAFSIDLLTRHYLIIDDKQIIIDPATTYSIGGDLYDASGGIVMFANQYNAVRKNMHLVNKINDNVIQFIAEFMLEMAHLHLEWSESTSLATSLFAFIDHQSIANILGVGDVYHNAIAIGVNGLSNITPAAVAAVEENVFRNYVMTDVNIQAVDEIAHGIKRALFELFPQFVDVYLSSRENADWGVYDVVITGGAIHFIYLGDYRIIDWTLANNKELQRNESEC